MKIRLVNIIVILIVAAVLAIVLFIQPSPKAGAVCTSDSECVKVQTTCCPCSAGGEEACVPAHNASLYRPTDCGDDIICIALYNCKIDTCSCQSGECKEILLEIPRP